VEIMSEKDQICDHCKDIIFSIKEDAYRIQKGTFTQIKDFLPTKEAKVYHERCFQLIMARAIVMADITNQLSVDNFSGKVKETLDEMTKTIRRI
jgi:hypothetical protein